MLSSWTGHHQPSPEQVLALAPAQAQAAYPPMFTSRAAVVWPLPLAAGRASGRCSGHRESLGSSASPTVTSPGSTMSARNSCSMVVIPASTASSLAFRTSTRARQSCRSACSWAFCAACEACASSSSRSFSHSARSPPGWAAAGSSGPGTPSGGSR